MDEHCDHDEPDLPYPKTPVAARTFYLRIFMQDRGRDEPIMRGELHRLDGPRHGGASPRSRLGAFNSLEGLTALIRRLLLHDDQPSSRE